MKKVVSNMAASIESARSKTRVNPITGEEMPYSARTPRNTVQNIAVVPRPASRPHSRPKEVPALALGGLAYENDPDKMMKLDPYEFKIDTPNSANTSVSWGTPTSVSSQLRQKEIQLQLILDEQQKNAGQQQKKAINTSARPGSGRQAGGASGDGILYRGSARDAKIHQAQHKHNTKQPTAWDKDPCPEDLPPPSAKHKQQYDKYREEMQESFRQNLHQLDESAIQDKIEQLRLEIPACAMVDETQDDDGDQTQKQWTQQPYSKKTMLKRQDIEELEMENRKKKLIETVMIDQLSRYVVCDPEQNEVIAKKPPSYHLPMKKGSYRKLHDSKLQTSGTSTENLLSRRVQFGARMLTRNGRDALRDLTGFFFALDNSITIYEFRQFGKGAKALPFIKRGKYRIPHGRRMDEHFSIADIMQGNTISFQTKGQPLPDHLFEQDIVNFRVTDVDDDAKALILLGHLDPLEREEVWKRVHLPLTQEEMDDRLLLQSVQNTVQNQIRHRGVKVFTNMSKVFKMLDENKDGRLNKYELEKALYDFRIEIPQEKFDDLWDIADIDQNSFLDFSEFMRIFIGEMNEKRKKLVRKVFLKMDPNKSGIASIDALGKFYNAHKHPKVIAREMREDQARQQFLVTFQDTEVQGQVAFSEFEVYYEGLSMGVPDDQDFENILKNAWGV